MRFVIVFCFLALALVKYSIEQEESKNPCPDGVPDDRMTWCTTDFPEYACTPEDYQSQKNEETAFNETMDELYALDCVMDQKMTDGEDETVEDRWQQTQNKTRWTIRSYVYNEILVEQTNCKNCTTHSKPKLFYDCMTEVRSHLNSLISHEMTMLGQYLQDQGVTPKPHCWDV